LDQVGLPQPFNININVQSNLEINCTLAGIGATPAAFTAAGLSDTETVTGVTYGTTGNIGDLFGWNNTGAGFWYVGGEASLDCLPTPGLTDVTVAAEANSGVGVNGFVNTGIVDLTTATPTTPLVDGAPPVQLFGGPQLVPFSQPVIIGSEIDPGDPPASNNTITFTFVAN
jgi:hypothetical protein